MLKYIKVLRHVSILTDHHQEVGLYLVKVTELLKKTLTNNNTCTSHSTIY